MGHAVFANYLKVPFIPGAGEGMVFAAAVCGGCIGFLWHNCHPASMFMGDTGSLALGGAVGFLAVLVRQEVLLILVGGVFVMEAGSVMLQVPYFKLTGKRIFPCTPIHHTFERRGWTETQIVVRFWILSGVFALDRAGDAQTALMLVPALPPQGWMREERCIFPVRRLRKRRGGGTFLHMTIQ